MAVVVCRVSKDACMWMTIVIMLIGSIFPAQAETEIWDCIECGRNGNTGNYCGSCGHPAPWIEAAEELEYVDEGNSIHQVEQFKKVGNIVQFGKYPQTKEGTDQTPIDWQVLEYDPVAEKALLVSKNILDAMPYNYEFTKITWEQCSLRNWLNNEFIDKAFDDEEKDIILSTTVDNSKSQGYVEKSGYEEWDVADGLVTEDRVFLLSFTEAWKYFQSEEDRKSQTTEYARKKDIRVPDWWLRTSRNDGAEAIAVNWEGHRNSYSVRYQYVGVRPAIWIDLTETTIVSSGIWENVRWELDDEGVLTISGSGEIAGDPDQDASWLSMSSNITKVIIKEGITQVGSGSFKKCVRLNEIVLPQSISEIGKEAFYGCISLKSITIPSRVEKIRVNAFYNCAKLEKVILSEGLNEIESNAFENCKNLSTISIPESVRDIGSSVFRYCESLGTINIPSGIEIIRSNSFSYCTKLKRISIPNGVQSIQDGAFSNCKNLEEVMLPEGLTGIGNNVFENCINLSAIIIPDSVRNIGNAAFSNCVSLETIELPSGMGTIKYSTFAFCTKLKHVKIPESVKVIQSWAFSYCEQLEELSLPANILRFEQIMDHCYSLKAVSVDDSNKSYTSIDGVLYTKNKDTIVKYPAQKEGSTYAINSNVKKIYDNAFEKCTYLQSITIPEGVISIGSLGFSGCSNLSSVVLPSGMKTLGYGAFSWCTELKSIEIPQSLTSIDSYAFTDCSKLASIKIPEGVKTIGKETFSGCYSLTSITLPKSITNIDVGAFGGCFRLKDVYYDREREDINIESGNSYLVKATWKMH